MSAEFSLHCNIVGPNKETFECGFRIIRDQNKTANAGPAANAYGPAANAYGPAANNAYGPAANAYGPAANNAYGPAANAYGPVIAICGKTIIRR